jgi:hypothetical protein
MNIIFHLLYLISSIFIFIFNIDKNNILYTNIYIVILILLIIQNFNYYNDINYIFKLIYFIFLLINSVYFYLSNLENLIESNIIYTLITILFLINTINLNINIHIKIIIITILIVLYYYNTDLLISVNKIINKNTSIKLLELKPKNIRVALCISGKIDHKNIKEIYESWQKNLINYYNVDIFMNIDEDNRYINEIIKPKRCVLFNKLIKNKNLDINSYTMFYRIYECNKYSIEYEKKYDFEYDIIIRLRCDIILFERLYLENFKKNISYFPTRKNKAEISNIYNLGITDQLFIADRKTMNKICNIYLNLNDNYLQKINCKIPEITLLYYLNKKNIKYVYFYYSWIINYYNANNTSLKLKFLKKILFIFNNSCFINILEK